MGVGGKIIMFKLENNGVYSLQVAENNGIYGMFPGIDGVPVRNIRAECSNEMLGVKISTLNGEISLSGDSGECNHFLKIEYQNAQELIHTLSVFFEAEVKGMVGIYQSAHEMGGPTGFISVEQLKNENEIVSDGLISIKFTKGILTFYGTDHSVYRNTYSVIRKGERFFLSCNIVIENCNIRNDKLPSIGIVSEGNMEEQLSYAANRIGNKMNARRCMQPAYHWCSWYYCYHNFDMHQLEEYLEGFKDLFEAV